MPFFKKKKKSIPIIDCTEFLLNGGDPEWLVGIECTPAKIQNFAACDAIASHQVCLFFLLLLLICSSCTKFDG